MSYLPLDLAHDTPISQPSRAKPGPGGIYARSEELAHHLDHFEEEIRARMPTSQEGKTLRLSAGNGRDSGSAPALTVGWSERPDGTLVYTLVRRR